METNNEHDVNLSGLAEMLFDDRDKPPLSVYVTDRRHCKYPVEWLSLFQGIDTGVTIMEQARMERPLTQTEYRVRDMILGAIGIGNWAIVNQAELARQIRVDRAEVSKAINRLIELGIVERGEKLGKSCQYKIALGFAFKGVIEHGQKLVQKAAKEHKTQVIQFAAAEEQAKKKDWREMYCCKGG